MRESIYTENEIVRDKMLHRQNMSSTLFKTVIMPRMMEDYTLQGHSTRLQVTAVCLGDTIGLSMVEIQKLQLLAQFHDIGKILIPKSILYKAGSLAVDEWVIMRRHPEIGFHLASLTAELMPVADWILKHHEWWDGSGYPFGLKGGDIPLEARIIHIVDAYDAMTHSRPYRQAMNSAAALEELEALAGIQFDPELVQRFVEVVAQKPHLGANMEDYF